MNIEAAILAEMKPRMYEMTKARWLPKQLIGYHPEGHESLLQVMRVGEKIGEITPEFIELVQPSGIILKFYNDEVEQPWARDATYQTLDGGKRRAPAREPEPEPEPKKKSAATAGQRAMF